MGPADEPVRDRTSIEERAARRDRIEQTGSDRYSSLLHTLRAGREITVQPTRRQRLEWHPVANKVIVAALVVVAAYAAISTGYRLIRERTVDTWAGPDATVVSGQKLDTCPFANSREYDGTYPTWLRFGGRVFVATGFAMPFGSNSDHAYLPAGYHLGEMELWKVANTDEGKAGDTLLLKLSSSPIGALFRVQPDCP